MEFDCPRLYDVFQDHPEDIIERLDPDIANAMEDGLTLLEEGYYIEWHGVAGAPTIKPNGE